MKEESWVSPRLCGLTTMEVRSSLSKRLMAWSRDLYIAAEILWVIRRFRSMERPSSCKTGKGTVTDGAEGFSTQGKMMAASVILLFQYLYMSLFEQRLVAV